MRWLVSAMWSCSSLYWLSSSAARAHRPAVYTVYSVQKCLKNIQIFFFKNNLNMDIAFGALVLFVK